MKKILTLIFCLMATTAWARFPTTPVIDNFNRANAAIGANWSLFFGDGLKIVSNTVALTVGGTGESGNFWNVKTDYKNVEVYITLSTISPLAMYFRTNTDATAGYLISWEGGTTITLFRLSDFATLLTATTESMASGDKFGCRMIGSTIECFDSIATVNGGAWKSLGTVIDTTVTAAGRVGIYTGNTTVRGDDFGGGEPNTGFLPLL